MEVHHHPHVEKKKFKEYFLEFIMIFLAVTLGFIAENIREHFAEEKSIHQYLQTFKQELIRNDAIINYEQKFMSTKLPLVDSLAIIFDEGRENQNLTQTVMFFNKLVSVFTPSIETASYQQMVNAGGLKIIDNVKLKDSLALYIDRIEKYKAYNLFINNQLSNTFPEVAKIIDILSVLKNDSGIVVPPFNIKDQKDRRTIVFYFSDIQDQYLTNLRTLIDLKYFNTRLIDIVTKELEN
jgi:hypothetical protein